MFPDLHPVMAYVTAPDLETGRRLAGAILEQRAAACVNIIPGVESHYWWEGKLESAQEVMLVMKTLRERVPGLEKCVRANHPYQVPEFIVLEISQGSQPYFNWIEQNVPKHSAPIT